MTAYLISTNIKIIQNSMVFFYFKIWLFERILWSIGITQKCKSAKEKSKGNKFVYDNDSDLYNSLLVNHDQQYSDCSYKEKKSKRSKHNFSELFLNDCEYNNYFDEEQKAIKKELDDLPPVEGDEEKKLWCIAKRLSKGVK